MIIGADSMNSKGQTLVEFVIILPVFLVLLFYIIDFGRIIYAKNKLENNLNEVVFLVENEKDTTKLVNSIGASLNISNSEGYMTISLSQKVNLIAPGLNAVLSDPYYINVSRVVYDKE